VPGVAEEALWRAMRDELSKQGLRVDPETTVLLRQLVKQGARRVETGSGSLTKIKVKEAKATARRRYGQAEPMYVHAVRIKTYKRGKVAVRRRRQPIAGNAEVAAANARKLARAMAVHSKSRGRRSVDKQSLRAALGGICPLWPFC